MDIPSASTAWPDIVRLQELQKQKRHGEALEEARALLAGAPQSRELVLIEASSLRHLGRVDEALAALARLERTHPRYSLLHEERGLCHVARKDAPNAIASLLTAVTLNPALPFSWRMLEGVYRLSGDAQNAAQAADHVATLNHLPPEFVAATSLFSARSRSPSEKREVAATTSGGR